MAPSDRRASRGRTRSGAHVAFARLFSAPLGTPLRRQSLFSTTGMSDVSRRARCDRRRMREIDRGIGTLAWPEPLRHRRKEKR